ncbi:MAG: HlyC/CorC family transporter [Euzebyales bacterium]|nr:HlyC/CorC family transporter [Euzebyales bacterium]MBA3620836.1 HlyC/CorC family transporter [Euzebyales bacterium]
MSLGAAVAAVVLLAVNGFFVAAEFALLASRRSKLEAQAAGGDARAVQAIAGIRELSLMLAGAQLGITMASLGLGAVAEPALAHALESLLGLARVPGALRHAIALAIALSIVIFLHMVVGEMAPKSWAISHPERSALGLVRPFRAFVLVLRPVIRGLNAMANGFVRLCGVQPQNELAMVHAPSDLLMLVHESGERGTLRGEQRELLSRALELTGLDAQAAMVPRGDIVAVPATAPVDEIERVASETGRSRLPVYDGDLDRLTGVLHVKDLLRVDGGQRASTTAATLARPAFLTPESRPIEDLMVDMRQQRAHIAMVVDEHGSVSGLVALEDLIEELIGDFEDETDFRARPASDRHRGLRLRQDGAVLLPGSLRPDELEDRCGVTLPEGSHETVAGAVIACLGRLPRAGDTVELAGVTLEVTRMEGNRVVELALRRLEP